MEHWQNFKQVLATADMLVVTGGGFINDCFSGHASISLRLMEYFVRQGRPVGLFGQGIGPLTQPEILSLAESVLPKINFIGLREGIASGAILEQLGVSRDRFEVTGDDAIAAVLEWTKPMGAKTSIGVNLRVADYARVDAAAGARVKDAIRRAAAQTGATILGLPVASGANDNDLASMADLLGNAGTQQAGQIQTPEQLIETAGHCRMVVTGSYHAAVFALSQGIPAIGLVASEYYESKFAGLAALFGAGCEMFRLDQAREGDLEAVITARYAEGEHFRSELLQAAESQRAKSAAAYEKFARQVHAASPTTTQ